MSRSGHWHWGVASVLASRICEKSGCALPTLNLETIVLGSKSAKLLIIAILIILLGKAPAAVAWRWGFSFLPFAIPQPA
jgi:hypothetical protein